MNQTNGWNFISINDSPIDKIIYLWMFSCVVKVWQDVIKFSPFLSNRYASLQLRKKAGMTKCWSEGIDWSSTNKSRSFEKANFSLARQGGATQYMKI